MQSSYPRPNLIYQRNQIKSLPYVNHMCTSSMFDTFLIIKDQNHKSNFSSKFVSKIKFFVQNQNLCQKSKCLVKNQKFSSKIKIFVKNPNLCQKLKWSNIKKNFKNRNFCQKLIFLAKIKILSKIKILVKNQNFCQKIKIFVKNQNFCQKS